MKTTKRNGMKRAIVFALALTLALSAGCGTAGKVTKQLALGDSYVESQDYASAIDAYAAALELDAYSIDAYEGMVLAMYYKDGATESVVAKAEEASDVITTLAATEEGLSMEQQTAATNFYNSMVDVVFIGNDEVLDSILSDAKDVFGEDSEYAKKYVENAKKLVDHYLAGNNYEKAAEVAKEYADGMPENKELADIVADVDAKSEEEAVYVETMKQAADIIDAGSWETLADFSLSPEVEELAAKIGDVGSYVYMFDGGTSGMGIGYYSMEGCECNEWYYGNYTDGVRDGQGGWYWAKFQDGELYVDNYVGSWSNDAPNGSGHLYCTLGETVYTDLDATVNNGLLEGTYPKSTTTEDGRVLETTYTAVAGEYLPAENIPESILEDVTEGDYVFAFITYEEGDGRETTTWWSVPEGYKEGAAHFR